MHAGRQELSSRRRSMDSTETQELIHRRPSPPSGDTTPLADPPEATNESRNPLKIIYEPVRWLRMLCHELNATFVVGVVLVYGVSQGSGGSYFDVAGDYYWKDVQKIQPATVEMYNGLYYIPWVMKPIWGVLTDVFPVSGYRRRPYFIIAGILGTLTAMIVATFNGLSADAALLCMVGVSAAIAIADVTIDACIAKNSAERPALATDMQSLCGLSSSVGQLVGYASSGTCVRLLGAQGAMGLMAIHAVLLIVLGFVIFELKMSHLSENTKVLEKLGKVARDMNRTIRRPQVWKPSLYMFLALALNISISDAKFYWFTECREGPRFSKELVGMVHASGVIASIVGVLIYQKLLKDKPFRALISSTQLLFSVSGMLDVALLLRWNLKLGISDCISAVVEECSSRILGQIQWLTMMVLGNKLCPVGNEGTFFALLMCINSFGALLAKFEGGVVLHLFHVTRTEFGNLWLVALARNLLRFLTLSFIFLLPQLNQSDALLPYELSKSSSNDKDHKIE